MGEGLRVEVVTEAATALSNRFHIPGSAPQVDISAKVGKGTSKTAHEARAEVKIDALNVLALLQQGRGARVEGFRVWMQGCGLRVLGEELRWHPKQPREVQTGCILWGARHPE